MSISKEVLNAENYDIFVAQPKEGSTVTFKIQKCNKNMADRFIEQSKEIANNFIQNIVFIDDKAYKNDMTNNAFSALDVSNVFAQSGKSVLYMHPNPFLMLIVTILY